MEVASQFLEDFHYHALSLPPSSWSRPRAARPKTIAQDKSVLHFGYHFLYTDSSQMRCDLKFSEQHSKQEKKNVLSGSHYPGLQAAGVVVLGVFGSVGSFRGQLDRVIYYVILRFS